TFDSLWSHAFSFALCAALLERLDAWVGTPDARHALVVGAIAGAMILVRHTNAIVPLAFVASSAFVEPRTRPLLWIVAAAALVVFFPQFLGHYPVEAPR